MSKKTTTHKLGEIKNQFGPAAAIFTMQRRIPRWHPDADDDGSGGRKELHIEEAIRVNSSGKFERFPVPTSAGHAFEEPTGAADGAVFNRWILGGKIEEQRPGESALTKLLRDLAVLVRRYNASLYRLRRLHFFLNAPAGSPLPPRNPAGDEELPPTGGRTIEDMVKDAEKDWKKVTKEIDDFIDNRPPHPTGLRNIMADMVEVNGYIVSMRVVTNATDERPVIGSSSSHVSISSAFSSS
jgi:hypothetical protein